MNTKIVNLIGFKLKKNPVHYNVEFTHNESGFSFVVYNIADSDRDREAVAKDLQAAALSLLEPN